MTTIFLALLLIGSGVIFAWYRRWAREGEALSAKERAELHDRHRQTLAQMLAWLAVACGAGLTVSAGLDAARQSRESHALAVSGQVTDRFSRALAQLVGPSTAERVGAAFALERIAIDSPSDARAVTSVLCSFLRESQPPLAAERSAAWERLAEDRQAAALVLGRLDRGTSKPELYLVGAQLNGLRLDDASLAGARLSEAHLAQAVLLRVNLGGAKMEKAILSEACLGGSTFAGADLKQAILHEADLGEVDLTGAVLLGADLSNANLSGANLTRANLGGADLRGAYLLGAQLDGVALNGARLEGASFAPPKQSRGLTIHVKNCDWQPQQISMIEATGLSPEGLASAFFDTTTLLPAALEGPASTLLAGTGSHSPPRQDAMAREQQPRTPTSQTVAPVSAGAAR